jgi:hypothetical protein
MEEIILCGVCDTSEENITVKKIYDSKCEHNITKKICKTCNPKAYCEHNKLKNNCVDCGGINICNHKKKKTNCKDCGGSSYCIHGKYKFACKDCKGKGICIHNKNKGSCKDCNPSAYCEHDREKRRCKDCKGSGICIHNKEKRRCVDCGGNELCKHNKQKRYCKECDGSAYCEHDIIKYSCKKCGGSNICEHNKNKYNCLICYPSSYCEHNRQKKYCKECSGSQICIHKKQKSKCKKCGGSSLCKSEWCEKTANKKYEGYCLFCYVNLFPDKPITRNYKTKEKDVVDRILKLFPDFTWVSDKKIKDGCSKRRPDLLLDMGSHVVIVEIDENAHTDYDCSCENKRLMEISQDLSHRPIVFIRFNPDDYKDKEGNKIKSCWKLNRKTGLIILDQKKIKEWEERINSLVEQINYWIKNPTEKTIEIIELFY